MNYITTNRLKELSRHENIQELLNGIQEFSLNAIEEGEPDKLENYLEDVALLTDQDNEKDEDRDKVTLMTVHSAKGLEFKNVFVVGMEENLFPSQRQGEKQYAGSTGRRTTFVLCGTNPCRRKCLVFLCQSKISLGKSRFLHSKSFFGRIGSNNFSIRLNLQRFSRKHAEIESEIQCKSETAQRFSTDRSPAPIIKTRNRQNIFGKKLVSLKETGNRSIRLPATIRQKYNREWSLNINGLEKEKF